MKIYDVLEKGNLILKENNIEDEYKPYTTNVKPENEVEKVYEPEGPDFTTLDNLR